jgi:hypothetical protein
MGKAGKKLYNGLHVSGERRQQKESWKEQREQLRQKAAFKLQSLHPDKV